MPAGNATVGRHQVGDTVTGLWRVSALLTEWLATVPQIKLEELEEQLAETQQQLDVSLTALYSSSEQTGQVVDTVARVQAKLKAQAVHGSRSQRVLKVKEARAAQKEGGGGGAEAQEGGDDEGDDEVRAGS